MNFRNKRVVFCEDCGECLGIHETDCAKKHLEKYPNHSNFLVKTMIDPLSLSNPDEWFERRKILPNDPTIFNKNNFRRRFTRTVLFLQFLNSLN